MIEVRRPHTCELLGYVPGSLSHTKEGKEWSFPRRIPLEGEVCNVVLKVEIFRRGNGPADGYFALSAGGIGVEVLREIVGWQEALAMEKLDDPVFVTPEPEGVELRRQLAELHREYEQKAKPLIDALVKYESTRLRPYLVLPSTTATPVSGSTIPTTSRGS
jgi:hypothetical protein